MLFKIHTSWIDFTGFFHTVNKDENVMMWILQVFVDTVFLYQKSSEAPLLALKIVAMFQVLQPVEPPKNSNAWNHSSPKKNWRKNKQKPNSL